MTTQNNTQQADTIVAFHIGRGGRFHNQGHLTYCGQKRIGDFLSRYDLHLAYENRHKVAAAIEGDEALQAAWEAIDPYNSPEENAPHIALLADHGHDLGELVYAKDTSGDDVGLTLAQEESGIGRIDNDGQYDTTYTCFLGDCDDNELRAIYQSTDPIHNFKTLCAEDREFIASRIGIEEEQEEEI